MGIQHITRLVFLLTISPLMLAAEEPAPSVGATPPANLANDPTNGLIAATASASPTPVAASGPQQQAVPSPSPVPNPAVAGALAASQPDSTPSPATPEPSATPGSKFDADLLGGKNPILDDEERAGVEITNAWREKSYGSMRSRPGENGSVEFEYGESYPAVVCAILQVTDVELEPGEVVTALNVGDTTRWSVESAVSGSGNGQVQHLIIKPRDIGLSTSLVVTTDRRTYHLILVSDQSDFMHSVRFVYGDERPPVPAATPTPVAAADSAATPKVAANPPRRRTKPDGKQVSLVKAEDADDADESYVVSGKADWKPVTVYSKDGKTYIEMPSSVRHKEAPVLFEEARKGWFHHEKILVNYRVKGNWYVVDKVIDKGTLVSGVGSNQVRVDIKHIDNPEKKGGPDQ